MALKLARNDITLWRDRGTDQVAFFAPSRVPVHTGCRIYECACGARNTRPFRNGRDLQRWERKHKHECTEPT